MTANATISRELVCLAALRQARSRFFRTLEKLAVDARQEAGDPVLSREQSKLLRSEGVAQIAEFFFIVRDGGISDPDALRSFLERHNDDMRVLLEDCERGYTSGGLSRERVERSIFTDKQIQYILHECESGEVRFDQQSLQRIFTQSMSFESCRKLLILLAECGFLNRWEYNQVLISSKGVLEDLYREHLSTIINAIAPVPQETS